MLKTIRLKSGVNRENTRYSNEGGWYESDKVRFRQGTPEVIGGWSQISGNTFLGICRSLWSWMTLALAVLTGVGTNLKFYISRGGAYYDVTPIRLRSSTVALVNPFTTVNTTTAVTVTSTAHGALAGDFVTFTGAVAVGGVPALDLNKQHTITSVTNANQFVITVATAATSSVTGGGAAVVATYYVYAETLGAAPFATTDGSSTVVVTDVDHGAITNDFVTFAGAAVVAGVTVVGGYQLTVLSTSTYSITVSGTANATTTGGGGAVTASYQINTGPSIQPVISGWGARTWGSGTWGSGVVSADSTIRLWSQSSYGEDLVFGPRYGGIYYWDATGGLTARAVDMSHMTGASYVPTKQLKLMVSDSSRFVIAFGCNDLDQTTLDPLLVRWSDQENNLEWFPEITNQAGSMRLSIGDTIYTAAQMRQEILVWTNAALYSMQYLGAPLVWGFSLLEGNMSCAGPNAVSVAAGVAYWMGVDKFYKYDGRVQTLRCDLKAFVFLDFNRIQAQQTACATNEGFNEIWWFYCSAESTTIDRYVVYNYAEDVWYHGNMARTAWLDTGLNQYPLAATYSNNLVAHETGVDDGETSTPVAISASITSAQFDIDDGHNFAFIWRLLPDITFRGSATTGATPTATITLYPLKNAGSGYTVPASVAGSNSGEVVRVGSYEVDQFTGQLNTRIRGRQLAISISSSTLGTTWQLGTPRMDIRPDGRQ